MSTKRQFLKLLGVGTAAAVVPAGAVEKVADLAPISAQMDALPTTSPARMEKIPQWPGCLIEQQYDVEEDDMRTAVRTRKGDAYHWVVYEGEENAVDTKMAKARLAELVNG